MIIKLDLPDHFTFHNTVANLERCIESTIMELDESVTGMDRNFSEEEDLLKALRQAKQVSGTIFDADAIIEYDSERRSPAPREDIHWVIRSIEDKPHRAPIYIADLLEHELEKVYSLEAETYKSINKVQESQAFVNGIQRAIFIFLAFMFIVGAILNTCGEPGSYSGVK